MPKFMIVYQYRTLGIWAQDTKFTNDYMHMMELQDGIEGCYHPIRMEVYAYSDDTGYVRLGGNL